VSSGIRDGVVFSLDCGVSGVTVLVHRTLGASQRVRPGPAAGSFEEFAFVALKRFALVARGELVVRLGAVFGSQAIYAHASLFDVGGGQPFACFAKGLCVARLVAVVVGQLVVVALAVGASSDRRLGIAADPFAGVARFLNNAVYVAMVVVGLVGV
jgi:hypothetical protein